MSFVENLQSMPRELKEVGKWQDWPGPRKMHYFSSIIGRETDKVVGSVRRLVLQC